MYYDGNIATAVVLPTEIDSGNYCKCCAVHLPVAALGSVPVRLLALVKESAKIVVLKVPV